jgi:hypothetical protein
MGGSCTVWKWMKRMGQTDQMGGLITIDKDYIRAGDRQREREARMGCSDKRNYNN